MTLTDIFYLAGLTVVLILIGSFLFALAGRWDSAGDEQRGLAAQAKSGKIQPDGQKRTYEAPIGSAETGEGLVPEDAHERRFTPGEIRAQQAAHHHRQAEAIARDQADWETGKARGVMGYLNHAPVQPDVEIWQNGKRVR